MKKPMGRGLPEMSAKDMKEVETVQRARIAAFQWKAEMKPEDRLRWVLAFSEEKLDVLSAPDRLDRSERLRTFMPQNSSGGPVSFGRMADETLIALQGEIRQGLRLCMDVAGDQPDPKTGIIPPHEWRVPGPALLSLYRFTPRFTVGAKGAETAPKTTVFNLRWDYEDERAWILGGIVLLIQAHGDRLRGCKECGAPFLATKRQIYCSPVCSQRVRDRNRPQVERATR